MGIIKNRWIKVLKISVVASLIVIGAFFVSDFFLHTDNLTVAKVNSPDGKYTAVIRVFCGEGVLGDVTTEVSLMKKGGKFIHRSIVFDADGCVFTNVSWRGASSLFIAYYPKKEYIKGNIIGVQKRTYKEINIFYEKYGNEEEIEKYSKIQYIPILNKQVYKLGEPIYLKIYLENRSDTPLKFDTFLCANFRPWFFVEFYSPQPLRAVQSRLSTTLTEKLNLGMDIIWEEGSKFFHKEFSKNDIVIYPQKKYLLFEERIDKYFNKPGTFAILLQPIYNGWLGTPLVKIEK